MQLSPVVKLEYFPPRFPIPKGNLTRGHLSRRDFNEMVRQGVFEMAAFRGIELNWKEGKPYVTIYANTQEQVEEIARGCRLPIPGGDL